MAVEAENTCLESMAFSQQNAFFSSQDLFIDSVFGIEDGFSNLDQLVDFYDNLQAPLSSSSSSSSFACSGSVPMEIVQSLSPELERQRVEMDWFLQLENKRLRRLILEELKRQQTVLLLKYESRINILMLQKDEELALARNKTTQLQDFLKAAEMEAKAWEKKAIEKEAIASDLQNRLNQVKKKNPGSAQQGDTVSFCDSCSFSSSSGGERRENKRIMMDSYCELCEQGRSLCVVFFPCRHLCCCKSCEPFLGHCPICQTVKEASLEVFLV